MVNVGDQAPDFEVGTHDGKRIKLSSLRGHYVLLWFFPKSDTPGCTIEGCGFRDFSGEYEKKNVKVFGVSFDTPAEQTAFVEKFKFNFPLLSDTERKLGVAFGAAESPSQANAKRVTVLIDPQGKVQRFYPKVDVKSHPEQILKDLV